MYVYKNKPISTLLAVCLAQLIVALDMAVVNLALPSMSTALGFAPVDLAWVVHAYALTFGGFLLLAGRAGDLYGRRRLFLGGLTAFAIASGLGGLAQEPWQLITARAVQGIAAAIVAPSALAMLTVTFPEGAARTRALGLWSGVNAVGGALGVLAGGLLTEYVGWRWVMFVNVPIATGGLLLALLATSTDPRPARRGRLDVPGAVLATAGSGLLVLGVVRTDRLGWGSAPTIGTLLAAVALLTAFLVLETRASEPLVRLGLFSNRWVLGANAFVFLAAAGQFSAFYFVSLYLQQVLDWSAATTGVAFLPFSAGTVAGVVLATRLTSGSSPRGTLIAGSLLAATGLGWFSLIDVAGTFVGNVLGPSLITSVGLGMCLGPVAAAALTGVRPADAGMASGLLNSARQLGGCIGLSSLATLAAHSAGHTPTPSRLTDAYALALTAAAAFLLLATVVALTVLPLTRHRRNPPVPDTASTLEGAPS
ncbi:MFS transporter [Cryptosporangium sp. NPDC048952]|uniref:MFS transporter n=1 Tax=Cryptosporangium sp. NPDC048952 TaxID=3363961 RepID=UPI0037212167